MTSSEHSSTTLPTDILDPKVGRVFYVDVIRSYGCLLVVISHIFAPVCAAMNEYPRSVWWVFNIFDSIIRLCVPLFVMISGKLFLGSTREESYLSFVWRRYALLIIPFFSWSMIYAAEEARMKNIPFSLGPSLLAFLAGPTEYHLWFMYIILGLYLITPFLRRFVQVARPNELRALLVLWMGYLILQFFSDDPSGSSRTVRLMDYGGYFILGYVLDKVKVGTKTLWTLAGVSAVIVLFNAWATFVATAGNEGTLDERYYEGLAPLVAVYAGAFFLILKNLDYRTLVPESSWIRRMVSGLSRQSYNVYLIHALFIWIFTQGKLGFVLSHNTLSNPMIGVAVTSAAVLASTLGLSMLLQRIPVLSQLLVLSSKPKRSLTKQTHA